MTCKMVGEVILVLGSLQNHAAIVDVRGGAMPVLASVQPILDYLR